MEIATSPIPLSDIASQLDPHLPRTSGYHVTDLIRAQERLVRGKAVEEDREGEFVENGLMSWGRIWEASARPWLNSYVLSLYMDFEPSIEITVDGIIGNLDGRIMNLNYPDVFTFAVIETKATTGNPDPLTKPAWIAQVKAYCYMENTTLAWFLVLHAPRGGAPDYRCYLHQVQFTKEELSEHWQSLLRTRDYLEAKRMEART